MVEQAQTQRNSSDEYFRDIEEAVRQAQTTAQRWADESARQPDTRTAELLAKVLKDPQGLDFTVQFVDGVIRPEDPHVAAEQLAEIGSQPVNFLPPWLKVPAKAGGLASHIAPKTVVATARRVFQQLVGDLVVSVSDKSLGRTIKRLRADGARLNVNLLGEAVLGEAEADRRLASTFDLLRRDDIDYVSLKASAVTGPHNAWAYQEIVDHAVRKLIPLYAYASKESRNGNNKFINLDMEEYHDLDLTIDVFTTLLDLPENKDLEAGIVLQSYLPDALGAMRHLQDWAAKRRANGGAAIKVRVVKGANLAMETVEADIHDWDLVTWESKRATDANYMRVLEWALRPEHIENVKIGVAGHNLFTIAFAWELAGMRGVRDGVDIEMLSGMAAPQQAAIRADVGDLLLYVPVVHPNEYDVAIAYLVRRLEENSASQNFMSSLADISSDPTIFTLEQDRFHAAIEQWKMEGDRRAVPNRHQNRQTETPSDIARPVCAPESGWHFKNTPDTDPALKANREWMAGIVRRVPASGLGTQTVDSHRVEDLERSSQIISTGVQAADEWVKLGIKERAEILHRAGIELGRRRADLIEVAAAELGKGVEQTDPEVSEAVDFAHYYAMSAEEIYATPGAEYTPCHLTVVTPPWNFPVSIPLGGVCAALAAGSAVILKPSAEAVRCSAVLVECLWEAGVPRDVLQLVVPASREVASSFVSDERVDRVILTGSIDTARLFRSMRPDLQLLAETSGKNSIIVTPSADLDLAVKDVVTSAFGHAGQKCSACSLVILVGSVGTSKRFHDQLVDATTSLVVDWPTNPLAEMDPLSTEPTAKAIRGLTQLEPGQHWEVKPRQLDDTGRLWSPGVRAGVEPGSEFHTVEYFVPVLGVMRVQTLDEAIAVQNGNEFGLTGGLHSLDADEINHWLDNVQVGNAYVNRGITGAIVQRQPFGGWKRSNIGPGTKAGGPNYLCAFGEFTPREPFIGEVNGDGLESAFEYASLAKQPLRDLVTAVSERFDDEELLGFKRDLAEWEYACATRFDALADPSALVSEKNILRYQCVDASIRVEHGVDPLDAIRVVAAALAPGEFGIIDSSGDDGHHEVVRTMGGNSDAMRAVEISMDPSVELPESVVGVFRKYSIADFVETHDEFVARMRVTDHQYDGRIRLLGGDRAQLARELDGDVDIAIWADSVTHSGRVEILPFVHEQAISITNHRFGNPTPLSSKVMSIS